MATENNNNNKKHHHARRFSERKYKFSLIALALVTIGYFATHFSDRLKDSYLTFIGGVGTVLTLYGAANVSNKWVLAKHGILAPGSDDDAMVVNSSGQLTPVNPPQQGNG